MLGRLIERADQTTRLLDIKYHLLHLVGVARNGAWPDLVQWGGVLRAAAGYHAFRRVAPGRVRTGGRRRVPPVGPLVPPQCRPYA